MFDTLPFSRHFTREATAPIRLAVGPEKTNVNGDFHGLHVLGDEADHLSLFADSSGQLCEVHVNQVKDSLFWEFARLRCLAPPGSYELDASISRDDANLAHQGWVLGAYAYERFKTRLRTPPNAARLLVATGDPQINETLELATSIYWMQDLVNTPANELGPQDLAAAAETLAAKYGGAITIFSGEQLLDEGFPLVHAVGRASARPPVMIDLSWGDDSCPNLTLIGKGVCFDSGGLSLKTPDAMSQMKKDMAGAAWAIAFARLVMARNLPLKLRLLIPAVENAVGNNALRPGDVLKARNGLTVEVTNTDAEGRLILADALAAASELDPGLLIDVATLTGAQRIACGYELPSYFTNNERLCSDVEYSIEKTGDPLWRSPLFEPYRAQLKSNVADLRNRAPTRIAGSILAALFLQEFVRAEVPWLHIDFMGWNTTGRAGRPEGGSAQAFRAMYDMVKNKFCE